MVGDATDPEAVQEAADIEHIRALADIFRRILGAAIAGAAAGTVIAGFGGRVVMRLAAALNPDAVGLETENGNVIGDITLSGTLALLVFGGFLTGLIASVVWTTVSPWIPGTGLRRALLAAPVAVALGGVLLVQADNHDFAILTEDLLIVAMLLALVGTFGFGLALLEGWLDRRMPRAGTDPRQYALTAGFLVLVGAVLFLPLTIGFYFSESACLCGVAPVPLAAPLIVTGVATVAWWAQRALGRPQPSIPVRVAGRLGLLTAVGLGAALLATEVTAIPV